MSGTEMMWNPFLRPAIPRAACSSKVGISKRKEEKNIQENKRRKIEDTNVIRSA